MLVVLAGLDAGELAVIAGLTFLGSVAAGLSGMGGGVIIAIAITPLVGIKPLVPTVSIAMLVNHVARVWVFRHSVDWRSALAVLATALPFTLVGSAIYVALPATVVAVVMGVFLVAFVPLRRVLARRAWRLGRPGLMAVGGVFGLVTGTTLGGGMLIVPALLGSGLSGAMLIGTDAVIGLSVLIGKAAMFGTLELLTPELVVIGLLVGLVSVPGVYLARWILEHTSVRLHTLLIELLIVGGGLSFVWRGLTS